MTRMNPTCAFAVGKVEGFMQRTNMVWIVNTPGIKIPADRMYGVVLPIAVLLLHLDYSAVVSIEPRLKVRETQDAEDLEVLVLRPV